MKRPEELDSADYPSGEFESQAVGRYIDSAEAYADQCEAEIKDLKDQLLENFRDKTTCMHPNGTHCAKCSGCDVIDDQIKAIEEKYE